MSENTTWTGMPCPPGQRTIGDALDAVQTQTLGGCHDSTMKAAIFAALTACKGHTPNLPTANPALDVTAHTGKVQTAINEAMKGNGADWGVVKSALEHGGAM